MSEYLDDGDWQPEDENWGVVDWVPEKPVTQVGVTQQELDALFQELQDILSHRTREEVQCLFDAIIRTYEQFGVVTKRGISAVIAWGRTQLDRYCDEVLGQQDVTN